MKQSIRITALVVAALGAVVAGGVGLAAGANDGPSPAAADCDKARVAVVVNRTKPNGNSWDALGGAPDIAMALDGKWAGKCKDTFKCTRNIAIHRMNPELVIVDSDIRKHDTIGIKQITVPGSFKVGAAKAEVTCSEQ